MRPGLDEYMMRLRMDFKAVENRNKPPLSSPDVVPSTAFVFSKELTHDGDSGRLLLAKRKSDRKDRYLVKHAYTDCACNEFIYTKLAQAMGYCMPDAVLFQVPPDEKRSYFKTEYIIGERFLNVIDPAPTYETIREQAKNWEHYFAFCGLYSLTGEADGAEILLADDDQIYRVDTTDAFPIGNRQLDFAGINQEIGGHNPYSELKEHLLSTDFSNALNISSCNVFLERCFQMGAAGRAHFLEPFARLQDIRVMSRVMRKIDSDLW